MWLGTVNPHFHPNCVFLSPVACAWQTFGGVVCNSSVFRLLFFPRGFKVSSLTIVITVSLYQTDSRKVLRRLQRYFESLDSEIFVYDTSYSFSRNLAVPFFLPLERISERLYPVTSRLLAACLTLSFCLTPYGRPPSSNSSLPLGDSLIKIYSSSNPVRPSTE